MRWRGPRALLLAAVSAWLALVVAGMSALFAYRIAPGAGAEAPPEWPAATELALRGDFTLVMVAHPRCPCTRASLAELSRLMTRLGGSLSGYVLLVRPEGIEDERWEETDLMTSAAIIDGVEVIVDRGGAEARRFGALTSGQTYLYDRSGALLFSGGITPSRGHQGNSVGRERIIALVNEGSADRDVSDVFGCPVFGAAEGGDKR